MSILIKGLAMPKNCMVCNFGDALMGKGFCYVSHCKQIEDYFVRNDRPSWCPITEVPPHGRLIDADALHIDLMDRGIADIQTNDLYEIRQVVDDAPTIIESEEE